MCIRDSLKELVEAIDRVVASLHRYFFLVRLAAGIVGALDLDHRRERLLKFDRRADEAFEVCLDSGRRLAVRGTKVGRLGETRPRARRSRIMIKHTKISACLTRRQWSRSARRMTESAPLRFRVKVRSNQWSVTLPMFCNHHWQPTTNEHQRPQMTK